jgi:flotillin
MEQQSLIIAGVIVLGIIILLLSIWAFISANYIRIAPNTAAVIFGRKNKSSSIGADGKPITKGYRLITGGGVFKIPFFEEVKFMDLSNRMLAIKVDDAPNKDGVMTTIEGNANVKFASDKGLLEMAVERFLGKDEREINQNIHENLSGHLRAVVGKMTIEQLINDKTALNQAVLEEANEDFMKMGIKIDFVNINDISDKDNYIKNLGRKRASEIKRDAEIGTANADRDSVKQTSIAKREGVEVANANQVQIFESNKERDVKAANMKALVDKQTEIANQAAPLSQAQALQAVVEAQAATAAAKEAAQAKVEEQKAIKEKQRYNAEKIVPAEAEKTARIITADGNKQAAVILAEGERDATAIKAKGEADAVLLKKKAEAEGEAAVIRERGLAEADAVRAKLLAEAEGTLEKAKAYEKLDETGKFLEILNSLQTLAPNVVREFAGVMSAATQHLANVDDISIIDFGGNSANGGSTGKFGGVGVELLTKFFAGLQGTGFDTSKLQNFIGVNDKKEEKQISKKGKAKAELKQENDISFDDVK